MRIPRPKSSIRAPRYPRALLVLAAGAAAASACGRPEPRMGGVMPASHDDPVLVTTPLGSAPAASQSAAAPVPPEPMLDGDVSPPYEPEQKK
jgi:hypothetical protein